MNRFENLCKLASVENWCWNVNCTTCGHQLFKYAFRELSKGKSPADDDWVISMRNDDIGSSLGEIPRRLTDRQKESLAILCRGADLRIISQSCKEPDWLGYLGLVLHHTCRNSSFSNLEIDKSDSVDVFKRLSDDWAAQLKVLVGGTTDAYVRLCEITDGKENGGLTLKDLEACECALLP